MERLNIVDLLGLTSQDQLLLILHAIFTLLQKATLKRRSTVLSLPLVLGFLPDANHRVQTKAALETHPISE